MDIRSEKVIITGAFGGFGAYLTEFLKDKTKRLCLIDINSQILQKYSNSDNISCYRCDLTNFQETTEVINEIFKQNPDLRILINNAGKIHNELLINLLNREDRRHSKNNWDNMLDINLTSVFNCSVNVIDHLIQNRSKGLIINISSISANGNAGQSAYSAAKAGVNALTKTWSRELSMFGIRTAGIAPGFFDTPATHTALKENTLKKIISEIPSKRLGNLEELTKSVLFIIENDFFNGKILEIDGGMVVSLG